MTVTPGVTPQGFVGLQQSDIIDELNAAFQAAYGASVDVSSDNLFGQLIGIVSEREALEWQAMAALAVSWFPNGAQGVYVDNLLTLFGLSRQTATATRTNPNPLILANGVTEYGLVLFGVPGTVVPSGSQISDGGSPANVFALDSAVTIAAGVSAIQTLVYSGTPTSGSFQLVLIGADGVTYTTPAIAYGTLVNYPVLQWSSAPSSGTYTLTLGSQTTAPIDISANASAVQAAIQALSGYSTVTVSGSTGTSFLLAFPAGAQPVITAAGTAAPSVTPSLQGVLNQLTNASTSATPFSSLTATQSGRSVVLNFGEQRAVPLVTVQNNTMAAGAQVINLSVLNTVSGAPAQGTGSATCTATGPTSVLAGALTTIVTPLSGWNGVTNQLDCLTGQNLETDASAIARLTASRAAQGTSSLASIVGKVQQVAGVTQALGFVNSTNAADQLLQFAGTPTVGSFTLNIGGTATSPLPYNATALQMQQAIQAVKGYERAIVTGSAAYGFNVSWNGSAGGQAQVLVTTASNSTGVALNAVFARPPHSVEMVVEGGADADIAQALLQNVAAGIATYGSPVALTTATVTANSASVTLASGTGVAIGQTVQMLGLSPGTTVTAINGNVITVSEVALSSVQGVAASFSWAQEVQDSLGNGHLVAFSRPVQVPIFVGLNLVTDVYQTPGVPSSGLNPSSQWNASNVATIEADILAVIDAIPIGGLVTALGTNGLSGSFRNVPGVVDATLAFGPTSSPVNTQPLQMLAYQVPSGQLSQIAVTYV